MHEKSKSSTMYESLKTLINMGRILSAHTFQRTRLLEKVTRDRETKFRLSIQSLDTYYTTPGWKPKAYLTSDITVSLDKVNDDRSLILDELHLGSCPDLRACGIKISVGEGDLLAKRFTRHIEAWTKASSADPGVHFLSLVGYIMDDNPPKEYFCTITPWMRNGTASDFFGGSCYSVTYKREFIAKLARDVALLHQIGLVHGYIKAAHVLVSNMEEPLIGYFGLSGPEEEADDQNLSSRPLRREYARWLPREMIIDESVPATAKADMFMFGMTVLEIMTGKKPWAEFEDTTLLYTKRIEDCNMLPQRPVAEGMDVIDDKLWAFLLRCWALNPDDRPTAVQALFKLELEAGVI